MKKIAASVLLLLATASGIAVAQSSSCENGIVRMAGGVNGTVTICPSLADKNPALTKQLNSLQTAMAKQQGQLVELAKLFKQVNGVSEDLSEKQQTDMLVRLLGLLSSQQQFAPSSLSTTIPSMSQQMMALHGKILQAKADPGASKKLSAMLENDLGNQIAQLDIPRAEETLSGILSQLQDINSNTKHTDESMSELLRIAKSNSMDSPQYLNNPDYFVRVFPSRTSGPSKLRLMLMHLGDTQRNFKDAQFQLSYSVDGKQKLTPYRVELSQMGSSAEQVDVDISNNMENFILCYSAFDARVNKRRYWKQAWKMDKDAPSMLRRSIDLRPASNAELADTEYAVCKAQ